MLRKIKRLLIRLSPLFKDTNFINAVHQIEKFIARILSVALIIVIIVSLVDLIIILSKDLFTTEPVGFFSKTLLEIFGLFLNILIALELLDNITAYLKKHIFQIELVITTALIAVARKVIIFDTNKYDKDNLIALAAAILALSVSYWLVKKVNPSDDHH